MSESPPLTKERWPCAYAEAIRSATDYVLTYHWSLWDEEEIKTLQTLFVLQESAVRVFSRLLMRKSTWVKSSGLQSYITPQDNDLASTTTLQQALNDLHEHTYLHILTESTPFEVAWEAAVAIFTQNDWNHFYKSICTAKLPKHNGKTELLECIYELLTAQKTIFGGTLKTSFAKKVCLYTRTEKVVRISKDVLVLFRRVQRLFQVKSVKISSKTSFESLSIKHLGTEWCDQLCICSRWFVPAVNDLI